MCGTRSASNQKIRGMVGGGAYGVALAKRVDVEEGESLVGFQDLEARDVAWCGWDEVSKSAR